MTAVIDLVMRPFRRLNISTTEFATLQAIMLFDPGRAHVFRRAEAHRHFLDTEGLDAASQRNVTAEQKKMINALYRHISLKYDVVEAAQRYQSILLRIPIIKVFARFIVDFMFLMEEE